uniref:Uncharacterized protein n=1 Tax=Oryza punctata TaxID=4537 RepID=A0A0E0MFZ5_ORYPU
MERGTNNGLHPWIWSSLLWSLKDSDCDCGARHRRWALSLDLKLVARCSKDGGDNDGPRHQRRALSMELGLPIAVLGEGQQWPWSEAPTTCSIL